jgi:hypothetical protein
MPEPRYTHDCTSCTFEGRHREYDIYHCGHTWIARKSDEPSDYITDRSLYALLDSLNGPREPEPCHATQGWLRNWENEH